MSPFNKAVLFDMDGVVLDTEPLYTKAEIRLFGEYGVIIPEEDWSLFRGCSEQDFFDLSMKRYKITEDRHIFMAKGREYVRDEFKTSLTFMPGFHQLHKLVIQHYCIGLVTASPRRNLNWLQTLINLDELFEHIISGDESEKNKPHPEPYLVMMKKLRVKPENVVIIEDSLQGIRAALASGAAVIAKTGSVPKSDLSIAHRIISHLDEITHNMIEDLLQRDK